MVFKTDSYNVSHFGMYPPGMTEASGYAEARWNKHGELLIDEDFATIRERANKDGFDDYYGVI